MEQLTVVLDVSTVEAFEDRFGVLHEALPRRAHVDSEAVVLDPGEAAPEPEDQTSAAEVVEQGDLLGDPDRVVPRQHDNCGAEAERPRLPGQPGEELEGVG